MLLRFPAKAVSSERQQEQLKAAAQAYSDAQSQNNQLKIELTESTSADFVERTARRDYGYCWYGEIIYQVGNLDEIQQETGFETMRNKRRGTPCAWVSFGIGSDAIRLLVAGWEKGQLCAVHRERRGTRLFAGLVGGMLTEESMQSSVNAVGEWARCARADGAQEIFVFATSAVRDAVNGSEFTARCESACGAKVEIVSGEEEAVLS